jgi:hypothetical protein
MLQIVKNYLSMRTAFAYDAPAVSRAHRMKQSAISHKLSVPLLQPFAFLPTLAPLALLARCARAHVAARKPPIWETPETQPPPPACAGKEADCNYWAHTGECSRNWKWMSRHCALSSGACLG